MKTRIVPIVCLCTLLGCREQITPDLILEKSIEYHDPEGRWKAFEGSFKVNLMNNDTLQRTTFVEMDIARGYFWYRQNEVEAGVVMDSCFVISGERTCDQIQRTRNYYVYLWGLPMKLRDPGTRLEPELTEEEFRGRPCYVLNVRYEKDVWFYYIDKENHALKGYMFYQDEANKQGEVIYLDEEELLDGMKIPKNRTWYTTPDHELLGTDILVVK